MWNRDAIGASRSGDAALSRASRTKPAVDVRGNARRRMAVAVGKRPAAHPRQFCRVIEEPASLSDDAVLRSPDQAHIPGRDALGPLGFLAKHQKRDAERGRLFLYSPESLRMRSLSRIFLTSSAWLQGPSRRIAGAPPRASRIAPATGGLG